MLLASGPKRSYHIMYGIRGPGSQSAMAEEFEAFEERLVHPGTPSGSSRRSIGRNAKGCAPERESVLLVRPSEVVWWGWRGSNPLPSVCQIATAVAGILKYGIPAVLFPKTRTTRDVLLVLVDCPVPPLGAAWGTSEQSRMLRLDNAANVRI